MGGLTTAPAAVTLRDEGSNVSSTIPGLSRSHIDARLTARFSLSGARVNAESPLELRGPFLRDNICSYYLRNVTAGIFAGDAYQVRATAEAGSTVRIGSTSATKVHAMPGGSACSEIHLEAEAGSSLVWGPHTTILQGGSRLRQGLRVTLHPGARVYLAEVLVLGRLARGENSAFSSFESALVVSDRGRTLYEERYVLTPGRSLATALAGYGVVVSVYALGVTAPEVRTKLRDAVCGSSARAGVSTLPSDGGLLVRGLTPSLSSGLSLGEAALDALLAS